MKLNDIVNQINRLLSNNSSFKLSFEILNFYINTSVDYINRSLYTDYNNPYDEFFSAPHYYDFIAKTNIEPFVSTTNDKHMVLNQDLSSFNYNIDTESYKPYIYLSDIDKLFTHIGDGVYNATVEYNQPIYNINVNYNYDVIPDRFIRSCVVYYATALYLEEEDETESQYVIYKNKAEEEIKYWKRQYYSCYDTDKKQNKCCNNKGKINPYYDYE